MESSYSKHDFELALQAAGVRQGDVLFTHSNLALFGRPDWAKNADALCEGFYTAFRAVLGTTGTLVVPTFTYSFCRNEEFDPRSTPSNCGLFAEWVRKRPEAVRSEDPIFSVAAIGMKAEELMRNVSLECFGPDSFWGRLLAANGIICNLNVFEAGSTFFHFVERQLNVPYRYDKMFAGMLRRGSEKVKRTAVYFCQDLTNPDTVASNDAFSALAYGAKAACKIPLGKGYVTAIRAADVLRLVKENLPARPWLLTRSGVTGVEPKLIRPATCSSDVSLPPSASPMQLVNALWRLPRDIVSDGYDAALQALASQAPMTLHEYPTGTHIWTWIVPEKWSCQEAWLETMDGRRLFSYADNPLHVMSYSLPFEGEVTREELLKHLYVHAKLPDAVPFKFKYYERDWGLCCTRQLCDSLQDEKYRVVIRSRFSYSTLKVGEVVAKGRSEETVVLCAHLCHPAMVNDDLTGVVVGLEVMRALLKRQDLRYTYRFLILPETIGSVAYLSHNEHLIPKMKTGLFLEMLGLPYPPALQLSFAGNTEGDKCFTLALKGHDAAGWTGEFRKVIGNDERQFNAPGVRVPMLSLSRVLHREHPDWPYHEYHSSHDTPERVAETTLRDSVELTLKMIETLEANRVPVNRFKGEVFCSRFGLHIDFYANPEGNKALFDIMYLVDGTRSLADIATEMGLSFAAVKGVVDEMARHGLVEYRDESPQP